MMWSKIGKSFVSAFTRKRKEEEEEKKCRTKVRRDKAWDDGEDGFFPLLLLG